MQPTIPLGARHNHTALKVENNQSRRKLTFWSLSKLPISGLYLHFLSRGRTFLLASLETDGPIVGKSREKVEPLSLLSSSIPFPFPFFLSSYRIVWSKVKWNVLSCHMSSSYWLLGSPLSLYPSTLDFSPIMCCHMSLMGPT